MTGTKKKIEWYPFELVPAPQELGRITLKKKESFEKNILPWAESLNIKINFPSVDPIPRTDLAFQGIKFAEKYSLSSNFIRAIFEAYWIESKNIGDLETLADIGEKAGLNREALLKSLIDGEFKEIHKNQNEEVSNWDFEVVPTFFIDEIKIQDFPRTLDAMKELFTKI